MRNLFEYTDNVSPAKYTSSLICERLVKNLNKVSKKWNNQSNDVTQSLNIRPLPTQSTAATTEVNSPRASNRSVPNLKIPLSPRGKESPTIFHKIMNGAPELSINTQPLHISEVSGRKSRMKTYIGYSSPKRAFSPDVTLNCIGRSDYRPKTVSFTSQTIQAQNAKINLRPNIYKPKQSLKSPTKFKPARVIDHKKNLGIEFRIQVRKVHTAAASIRSVPMTTQTSSYSSYSPFPFKTLDRNIPTLLSSDMLMPKLPWVKIRSKTESVNILTLDKKINKLDSESNEKGTTTVFLSDDDEI